MIRWAPFWPMPGTVVSVLTSSAATARRSVVGREHGEHRLGQLGPDPAGGLDELEDRLLVVVEEAEQRQRVLAHDHAGRQRRRLRRCAAWPACRACTCSSRPTPPTSRTAESRPTAATGPRTNAIIGLLLPAAAGRRAAASMRAWAPPRQMWQIASASASAASAGLGGASSRSSRVTIAPTWALSARPLPETAALTSLGVCSATGSPRRAAHDHRDAAGLGGAHHGAGRCAGEDPLDRDRVGPVLVEPAPRCRARSSHSRCGDRQRRRRCGRRRRRPACSGRPTDALDHAQAAAGQAGVDPQHAHAARPLVRTAVRTPR